jgi:hypothetical protein
MVDVNEALYYDNEYLKKELYKLEEENQCVICEHYFFFFFDFKRFFFKRN